MSRVLNKKYVRHSVLYGPNVVYIGRPSIWGNPFFIGEHGDRKEVIERYREYILRRPDLLAQLPNLKGKDLVCWCAPLPCHGDVLLELVEELA